MPFADLTEFEKNPVVEHVSDLFTVDLITRYIQGEAGGERYLTPCATFFRPWSGQGFTATQALDRSSEPRIDGKPLSGQGLPSVSSLHL